MIRKNRITNRELDRLLYDRAKAREGGDCFLYASMVYDHAVESGLGQVGRLTPAEESVVKGHLESCAYCHYRYLDLVQELRQAGKEENLEPLAQEVEQARRAGEPTVQSWRDVISRVAAEIRVSLFPYQPAYARGGQLIEQRGEVYEFRKSLPQLFHLLVPRKAGYQPVVILEDPEGKKKVFYPHEFWHTDAGKKRLLEEKDALSLILTSSQEDTRVGEYRFLVFLVKGLNVEQVGIPFKDVEAHDREAEALLRVIAEMPKTDRLSSLRAYRIVE